MRINSLNDEKSVMVVDDDPSVRESMSQLLEAIDYVVLQADNGQTALDLLKKRATFPMFGHPGSCDAHHGWPPVSRNSR